MSALEELGNVVTIHFIGESHCLSFGGIYRAAWADTVFLCRAKYVPGGLRASGYVDANGALNEGVAKAFAAEGLFDGRSRPAHLVSELPHVYPIFLERRPMLAPVVVLFAGEQDIRRLFMQLGDTYDFRMPGDRLYGANPAKTPIPFTNLRLELEKLLKPFVSGVRLLQAMGFSRLMVHALWPPTRDALKAASLNEGQVFPDKTVRAKLIIMANKFLGEACRDIGVPFIDPWNEASEDGYLKPDYELDGVHVNRAAAALSLVKIVETLFDRTAGTHNPMRYAMLVPLSAALPADDSAAGQAWRERGFVSGRLGADAARQLAADLDFSRPAVNDRAHPDWVGSPRGGRPGVVLAEPDAAVLEGAARLLGGAAGKALLQAGAAAETTVASFRPLEIAPSSESPVALSDLAAPPAVRRAILMLGGEGSVALQSLAGDTVAALPSEPGCLVVWDPQRLRCSASAEGGGMRLAELALIPRVSGAPFRVVWAGLNDFPADPFLYTVANLRAVPPFAGDKVIVAPFTG